MQTISLPVDSLKILKMFLSLEFKDSTEGTNRFVQESITIRLISLLA